MRIPIVCDHCVWTLSLFRLSKRTNYVRWFNLVFTEWCFFIFSQLGFWWWYFWQCKLAYSNTHIHSTRGLSCGFNNYSFKRRRQSAMLQLEYWRIFCLYLNSNSMECYSFGLWGVCRGSREYGLHRMGCSTRYVYTEFTCECQLPYLCGASRYQFRGWCLYPR